MKITSPLQQNTIKLKVESLDDLWCLSTIIDKDDIIRGRTIRKITLGDKSSEKVNVVKKPMFLGISTEKTTFSDHTLKILGTIQEGPEDIPRGTHHSFNIQVNDEVEIQKSWLKYQLNKIDEAVKKEDVTIIACLYDREEAIFGKLNQNFFSKISSLKGEVEKKDMQQQAHDFFAEILKTIDELDKRYKPKFIIFASSHFWKKNMQDKIENNQTLTKKSVFTTVNATNESGFAEILTKPEVENALQNLHAVKDAILVDKIFKKIANEEPVAYGIKDCIETANLGAVEELICSENLIKKLREEDNFEELEEVFKTIESQNGTIHLMSGKSDAIKKLDGLGGISAILRFKIN